MEKTKKSNVEKPKRTERPKRPKTVDAAVGVKDKAKKEKPKKKTARFNYKKCIIIFSILSIFCGGAACAFVFFVWPLFNDPCSNPSPDQSEYDILLCERIHEGVTCTFDVTQCTTPCVLGYEQDDYECPISCKCAGDGTFETDVSFNDINIQSVLTSYLPSEDSALEFTGSVSVQENLWDNHVVDGRPVVPYVFADDVYTNPVAKAAIETAIDRYANQTCLDLKVRTTENDFLEFTAKAKGCRSYIGRMGGRQVVTIGKGCARIGIVQHEILHALGFWHEQSRPDRDHHVQVKLENVATSYQHNFKVRGRSSVRDLGSGYDIGSVMHYGGLSFSRNRLPTIVSKANGETVKAQRDHLTVEDLKEVNTLYKCSPENMNLVSALGDKWAEWGDWASCSASCGRGLKVRVRGCRDAVDTVVHDRRCGTEYYESEGCEEKSCSKGMWGEWSSCSTTCGEGVRHRESCCDRKSKIEKESCTLDPCPQSASDAKWSSWREWSACSLTCGGGWRKRSRSCVDAAESTLPPQRCPADLPAFSELQQCATEDCGAAGTTSPKWDEWGEWLSCSRTCDTGVQFRKRKCVGGFPGSGNCIGDPDEMKSCLITRCPESNEVVEIANWGPWWGWTLCSSSCGSGTRERKRICYKLHYKPGIHCISNDVEKSVEFEQEDCQIKVCSAVIAVFSEEVATWKDWSAWSPCTKTCGDGLQSRERTCKNGEVGEEGCMGSLYQIQPCSIISCYERFITEVIVAWSPWSQWSGCSVNKTQVQRRSCVDDLGEVMQGCTGVSERWKDCRVCDEWQTWNGWGACSRSCGLGVQERIRNCSFASKCADGSKESRECFNQCPLSTGIPWQIQTHLCKGWTTVAKINIDHYYDIVCVENFTQVKVVMNDNLNFLVHHTVLVNVCPVYGGKLFLADFNGDYLDDILCVDAYNGTARVTLNRNGGYRGSAQIDTQLHGFCNDTFSFIQPAYTKPNHKADLLCFDEDGYAQVLPNAL